MTSDTTAAAFQEQLQALRTSYAQEIPRKLQAIDTLSQFLLTQRWSDADAQTLRRMAHTLAGSSATFGFAMVSSVARQIEQCVAAILECAAAPTEEQRADLGDALGVLRRITPEAAAPAPSIVRLT